MHKVKNPKWMKNRLRELRIREGWTLKEVEKRSGIPSATVSKSERESLLTLETAVEFSIFYGLSIYEIWPNIPKPKK